MSSSTDEFHPNYDNDTSFAGGQFSSPSPSLYCAIQGQAEIESHEALNDHCLDTDSESSAEQRVSRRSTGLPHITVEDLSPHHSPFNRRFHDDEESNTTQSSLQAYYDQDNRSDERRPPQHDHSNHTTLSSESEKKMYKNMVDNLFQTLCHERTNRAQETLLKDQEISDLYRELAVSRETIQRLLQSNSDLRLDCIASQRNIEGMIALAMAQNQILESKIAPLLVLQQGNTHEDTSTQSMEEEEEQER